MIPIGSEVGWAPELVWKGGKVKMSYHCPCQDIFQL